MFPKLFGRAESLGSITPEQLKEVLRSIESKYTTLQDENFDLHSKLKESEESLARELAKALSAPKPKLGPERRLIRTLENPAPQALEEEKKILETAGKELENRLQEEKKEIEELLEESRARILELQTKTLELQTQILEFQAQSLELQAQIPPPEELGRLEALLSEQAVQTERLAQLSSELDQALGEDSRLREQCEVLGGAIETLENEKEADRTLIRELENEVERLLEESRARIQEFRAQIQELQTQVQEFQTKTLELQTQVLEFQAQSLELQAQIPPPEELGRLEALLSEQAAQTERLAQLSSELDQALGEDSRLREQCEALDGTIETLENEKEADRTLIRELENEVERLLSSPPEPAKPEKAPPSQPGPTVPPERQKRRELLARMIRGSDA